MREPADTLHRDQHTRRHEGDHADHRLADAVHLDLLCRTAPRLVDGIGHVADEVEVRIQVYELGTVCPRYHRHEPIGQRHGEA